MTSDYDPDRTKDGVPVWNGEASTFQSYEERALQWEQGVQWNKRYLCGPRLVSELTGTARKLIVGKLPDWLSFNGGVQYLLEHLRVSLGRPQISDMTDHLNRYFKSTKRKKMESMNDYITRKTEAYERARQALVRVERQYGKDHRRDDWTQWHGSSYSGHGLEAEAWWTSIDFPEPEAEAIAYWEDAEAAIEVAIDMPTTKRGLRAMEAEMAGYFVSAMRRRAVELSEKKMDATTRAQFEGAKGVEVKNFIAARAFETIPAHQQPPREKAIGMRWILTWKVKDDGSTKPKARAILLGYQDPGYEHRATTTPVMTKQSRQLFLQLAAIRQWKTQKGWCIPSGKGVPNRPLLCTMPRDLPSHGNRRRQHHQGEAWMLWFGRCSLRVVS
eukprot:symbB.v1.2.006699.t1/scaffold404.1/size210989/5